LKHTPLLMGLVPGIKEQVEAEAEKIANQWLGKYRVQIKNLSDERQEVYRQIREMSTHPLAVDLARPNMWMQPTKAREADGREVDLPRFERHLLCDDDGRFPEAFSSSWEEDILLAELERQGTIAWYRNPSRASQDSLGITYEDGDEIRLVRPDFVFFAKMSDGSIAADIVDPHGIQFGDALPKLKGLAAYAESNRDSYRRIEAVAKVDGKFRVLDLTEVDVRNAIANAQTIRSIYDSDAASDYLV
jgi:type III restriction enzyme